MVACDNFVSLYDRFISSAFCYLSTAYLSNAYLGSLVSNSCSYGTLHTPSCLVGETKGVFWPYVKATGFLYLYPWLFALWTRERENIFRRKEAYSYSLSGSCFSVWNCFFKQVWYVHKSNQDCLTWLYSQTSVLSRELEKLEKEETWYIGFTLNLKSFLHCQHILDMWWRTSHCKSPLFEKKTQKSILFLVVYFSKEFWSVTCCCLTWGSSQDFIMALGE